jgi:phosphate transport system substrate-binding protein
MTHSSKRSLPKALLLIFLICLSVLGVGYSIYLFIKNQNSTPDPSENIDPEEFVTNLDHRNYPEVDGSTSTRPLTRFIACHLLEVECEWKKSQYLVNTRSYLPKQNDPNQMNKPETLINNLMHSGTHGSYTALINDETDLILVARKPSNDELVLAASKNIELEITPVALDAFIFIANQDNPVSDLTTAQIQDIYTGKISNWSEVGGADKEINAYQRNQNSGSQELMNSLVMKDLEMKDDLDSMILSAMMKPINKVSNDRDGIGYSVYYYKEFMAPDESLKSLSIDAVKPTSKTIADKSYKYTTEVYAVIRTDLDKSSNAYQLRDWILSEDGQKIVEESGYVPIK